MEYHIIGNAGVRSEIGVILPTYGEAANIASIIEDIERLDLDVSILIIDDSSPDGTAEVVLENKNISQSVVV